MTCSLRFGPVTMRVQKTQKITRRTLYGQGLLTRTDRPQAPPGRGRARQRLHHRSGGSRVGHQRGYLSPLEEPLWRDELTGGKTPERTRKRECAPEEVGRRAGSGYRHPEGGEPGKLLSPDRRRKAVIHVQKTFELSERRACQAIGQPRSTQRYSGKRAGIDEALAFRMSELSRKNPRYGYRRGWGLLCRGGWGGEKKSG